MSNPYQHILNDCAVDDVIRMAAQVDEAQLVEFVKKFRDNEIVQIGAWTFEHLRTGSVHAVFERGCLLYLYHTMTNDLGSGSLFYGMIKEMGVSRTQAYREMQVWRRFAADFSKHPDLMHRFVPEALKLLSQTTAPESARTEAIDLAQQGVGIDINEAKLLLRKNRRLGEAPDTKRSTTGPTTAPVTPTRHVRRPVTQAKSFIKKVIRLVRRPKRPLPRREVEAIVSELERAIKEIRGDALGVNSNSDARLHSGGSR